jgi:protein TonB
LTAAGNKNSNGPESPWARLQRQSRLIIIAAFVVSALFHLLSYIKLSGYRQPPRSTIQTNNSPIKVRITQKPKEQVVPEPDAVTGEKILEVPQLETQKPVDASHLGNVNHSTEKETRVEVKKQQKALDPGQQGNPEALAKAPPPQKKQEATPKEKTPILGKTGNVVIGKSTNEKEPRNAYESLLPSSINDLYGQVNAGYQDHLNDDLAIGDRIDINTTEYRFIGYFTNMRKAIELVWNYPSEASMRGMQGEVGLEFAINKDGTAGRIRVLKSSGYDVLDRAIVEAIKLASPFSPLPNGFKKNKLVVTGSFRYILSAYGSH